MSHAKLLDELRSRQVKPEPVRCTCSIKCWCNQLSFRFPADQPWEKCLSPAEMLEQYGNHMDKDDIKYLKTLLGREFIS